MDNPNSLELKSMIVVDFPFRDIYRGSNVHPSGVILAGNQSEAALGRLQTRTYRAVNESRSLKQ